MKILNFGSLFRTHRKNVFDFGPQKKNVDLEFGTLDGRGLLSLINTEGVLDMSVAVAAHALPQKLDPANITDGVYVVANGEHLYAPESWGHRRADGVCVIKGNMRLYVSTRSYEVTYADVALATTGLWSLPSRIAAIMLYDARKGINDVLVGMGCDKMPDTWLWTCDKHDKSSHYVLEMGDGSIRPRSNDYKVYALGVLGPYYRGQTVKKSER